ncbi:uncharacterized protein Hap1MRO34_025796 [Clarias gariepinus]
MCLSISFWYITPLHSTLFTQFKIEPRTYHLLYGPTLDWDVTEVGARPGLLNKTFIDSILVSAGVNNFPNMAAFDLTMFTLCPNLEEFDKCRKDDLLLIADFFNILVPKSASKKVVKATIYEALVADQVLPEREVSEGVSTQPLPRAGDTRTVAEHGEELGAVRPKRPTDSVDPVLQLALKELDLKIKRQEYETQLLRIRERELDAEGKKLELAAQSRKPVPLPRKFGSPAAVSPSPVGADVSSALASPLAPLQSSPVSQPVFDVSRHVGLVPIFREEEVDSYFAVFERIATTLRWPKSLWTLLLQCKLTGKAQEACSALSLEQSLDYDVVKAAVLRAYERVPEAYRQSFRNLVKPNSQTFVEFAREKCLLFEKWCSASNVRSFEQLKELMLLEEFKSCLPEQLVVYLNEQKIDVLSRAAVLADEFVLTHKTVFNMPLSHTNSSLRQLKSRNPTAQARSLVSPSPESRNCYYCHEKGHLIASCPVLQRKVARQQPASKKVNAAGLLAKSTGESVFESFISSGYVSLGAGQTRNPIKILRDTGSAQSFILETALPSSEASYLGSDVLIQGIGMTVIRAPLHKLYLETKSFSGFVKVAVRTALPVSGISFILGNDIAGNQIFSLPEVVSEPIADCPELEAQIPSVFPACVLTRAQQKKLGDVIDLSDSFLCQEETIKESMPQLNPSVTFTDVPKATSKPDAELRITRAKLAIAQKADPSLTHCFETAVEKGELEKHPIAYFLENGVLMRKWSPPHSSNGLSDVYQVVVPQELRSEVLMLAHDHPCSGHGALAIGKSYCVPSFEIMSGPNENSVGP